MKKLKSLRLLNGYSQQKIADILNVKRNTYTEIESGKSRLQEDKLIVLSDFYNVPIDELLGRNVDREVLERNAQFYQQLLDSSFKKE